MGQCLGFGTWLITGDDATKAVRDALQVGYRHIDTARAHGNERAVQDSLTWLGVDRLDHVSPIPKASSHARRQENVDGLDFELSPEERAEIDALPNDVRTADPPWAPDWDA